VPVRHFAFEEGEGREAGLRSRHERDGSIRTPGHAGSASQRCSACGERQEGGLNMRRQRRAKRARPSPAPLLTVCANVGGTVMKASTPTIANVAAAPICRGAASGASQEPDKTGC